MQTQLRRAWRTRRARAATIAAATTVMALLAAPAAMAGSTVYGSGPVGDSTLGDDGVLVNNGTAFRYTFTYPIDRPSAVYQAEISQDLAGWTDIGSTLVSTAGGMANREVTIPVVSGGPSARFLRLKAIVAP